MSQRYLIVVVFNLSKALNDCVQELQYWKSFVDNQLHSYAHDPLIIFAASYADVVKSQGLDPALKAKQVIETSFGDRYPHEAVFLDCQQKYSPGLETISEYIKKFLTISQKNVETKSYLLLFCMICRDTIIANSANS